MPQRSAFSFTVSSAIEFHACRFAEANAGLFPENPALIRKDFLLVFQNPLLVF
jgi:hypothetical protein